MWHSGRATARQLLARGCHDNRQTDANETPSLPVTNGSRGCDWLLDSPSFHLVLSPFSFSRLSCDGKLQQSAVTGPPDGLDWLPVSRLETYADAAYGLHRDPTGHRQSNGSARSVVRSRSRISPALADALYREVTHRRQSIRKYADVERRQEVATVQIREMPREKEEAVEVSLLGIILSKLCAPSCWIIFGVYSLFPASHVG
ncbi:hypothetical protein GE09DRAFT_526779 [Coniochaeta sp. 2T2.1]|nr:hypothetical protein GE09DRAFT_526779 [Coniochaeta sp. 2T2.1]